MKCKYATVKNLFFLVEATNTSLLTTNTIKTLTESTSFNIPEFSSSSNDSFISTYDVRSYNRGGEGAAFSLQFSCYLGLITKQVMFSINLTNERGFPDIPIPIYIFILPYRIHVTSYHFLLGMCVHACVYLFIYLFTTMFNNNNTHEKIDDTLPWGEG